ncbi:unnamed protein product [Scytosiphon promiscuus]
MVRQGSTLLRCRGGNIESLVRSVGANLFLLFTSIRIQSILNSATLNVSKMWQLFRVLSPGAPVDVRAGGCFDAEVAYGNHPSILPQSDKITDKIVSDVVLGRALVFDIQSREVLGWRVSLLGVVEDKFRIIPPRSAGAHGQGSIKTPTSTAPQNAF